MTKWFQRSEMIQAGRAFSKYVFEKYFKHLNEDEWEVVTDSNPFSPFEFGETRERALKNIPVSVTDKMFFGTRDIQPRFSMQLKKDGEQVSVHFGLEAWETDREFCKEIFDEFSTFLEREGYDWLLTAPPVNYVLIKDKPLKLVPTGGKSKFVIQYLLNKGAEVDYYSIMLGKNTCVITNIQDCIIEEIPPIDFSQIRYE